MKDPWICSGCGKRFGGLTMYNRHKVGAFRGLIHGTSGICRNAYQMALMGYVLKQGVWRMPIPENQQWWSK